MTKFTIVGEHNILFSIEALPGINKQVYFGALRDLRLKMDMSGKWWTAIDEAYQSNFRFYHTHKKINLMLGDLDWCVSNRVGLTEREYDLLTLVMIFLDVGFDARDYLWEVTSATLWTEFADCVNMSDHEKMIGYHLIVGLADHNPYDIMSTILYDADLLVYSEFEHNYGVFKRQLRSEYKYLSDHEWKQYRLMELDFMNQRPSIYLNEIIPTSQENLARKNIMREIQELNDSSPSPSLVSVNADYL